MKQKRETKQAKTPKVRILYYLFLFLFASSLSPPVSRVGAIETRAKRGMEVASYINTPFYMTDDLGELYKHAFYMT